MFSVFSKSDKVGNTAINYVGEIGNNGYMNYSMTLPISDIKISVKTNTEDRYNGKFRNVNKANIFMKGQKVKKEFAQIGKIESVDINSIVHATVAYDYVRKNMPEEAPRFLDALNRVLSYDKNVVNSQLMLDKVFGDGKVNLDALVEAEVDAQIEKNNQYYDKYNSGFLGKLKDGLVKASKPFVLAFDKIKDLFKGNQDEFLNDDYYDRF